MTTDDRDSLSLPGEESRSLASGAPSGQKKRWRGLLVLLAVSVLAALLVKTFVMQVFVIPSASMEPGLQVGDRIAVNKLSTTPQRGDVVVFTDPGHWIEGGNDAGAIARILGSVGLYPTSGHLVKRVIGVPGDVIECCDADGRLVINGEPVDERSFIQTKNDQACAGAMAGCRWKTTQVPDGKLFVMGDNRSNSRDSTQFVCTPEELAGDFCDDRGAFIDADLVEGAVWGIVWPIDRWRKLDANDAYQSVP